MTEPFERLREARARAGYKGPAEVSRRFGWNLQTYTKHESGGRGITARAAARYARAYRVTPAWILFGSGAPEAQIADVPQLNEAVLARAIAAARRIVAAAEREGDQELEALIVSAIYAVLLLNGSPISEDEPTLAIVEELSRRIVAHTRKR